LPLLERFGMRGTFFVNSGLVGEPGHLTFDQLRHMQAIGHEIAGQTISHTPLPGLSVSEMRREVCVDRERLLAQGLAVDAFAYPFGAYSSLARDVVVSCGYASARLASGIAGAGKVCTNCPYAESIPPRRQFATRIPAGVQRTSTVARLTGAVAQAQRRGGGWVQILIHHVCHRCYRYSITAGTLERLLRWLSRRPGVAVRTVSQLLDVGGPTVRVVAPSSPWRVGRWATLPVRFHAPRGVRRVRYFVDGRRVGMRSIAPWRLKLYTGALSPGRHTLRALLEDARGNAALSRQRVFVKRDRPGPGR
ncbi:MAG: polysaccharide deacetylase family protein, partial [Solirubrobacteraceae bacterium]